MSENKQQPDLETRFLEPEGWRWHRFEREGRSIRFGCVFPKDSIPDAVIVCLQGVREFSEKYFETARWALDHNIAFYIMDWAGQGGSTRFLPNRQKRHSTGFHHDVEDLQYFIREYVKHSCVHPDKGRIPMTLLAHSMGANIALRHMSKYPDVFECAALTSPMIGIKVFKFIPQSFALALTGLFGSLLGNSYVPGGDDWGKRGEHARLTSDPVRKKVQDAWCRTDESLQCGDVTFGWLHQAQKSCMAVQSSSVSGIIATPCLFAIPAHEDLVDNKKSLKVISNIHNAKVIEYPRSAHEILMETDNIRDDFLGHFYNLVKEMIIDRPDTLKPF